MYPFIRMSYHRRRARRAAPLALGDPHIAQHICWPIDLDPWRELNNGRTLTLYDLGRIPLFIRSGLTKALRAQGWRVTVAGASMRYRRRVAVFDRFEMRSAMVGHDRRFFYVGQSMWKEGEALSSALYRMAIVGENGIVAPAEALAAMGRPDWAPELPAWVQSWIAAESERPWPPQP